MALDVVEEKKVTPSNVEPGDHEKFSHYVPKSMLERAIFEGRSVVALCGKVWLPSKDPSRFPICPECKEIHSKMRPGDEGDVE